MNNSDDFNRLINRLNASKTSVQIATTKGVRRAGLLVEGDAKRLVAVDTGRLRGSINTAVEETSNGAIAGVGTNVFYAPYVEYGTGQRGDSSVDHRLDWIGQAPQPFLRPAFAFNRDSGNISKIIQDEVRKVLKAKP